MSTETMITALMTLFGFVFSVIVIVAVMPKIENACELPMPPLPSYWLGHAWQFLDIKNLLRTNLAWFRELGEVFQIWIIHRQVVVTANPHDVMHILGKPTLFARPQAQTALFNDLQPNNFQTMPRDVHHLHRTRLREAFNQKTVKGFAGTVSRAANSLIQRMKCAIEEKPGAPVNFTPEVADTTFTILLEAVLGSKIGASKRDKFVRDSHVLLCELLIEYFTYPLRRIFAFTGIRRKLFSNHREVLKLPQELVEAREKETKKERAARHCDVLDVIRELDPNDKQRQVSNVTMFCIAGFESSSEAIAWAVYEICGHPDVTNKIQAELDDVLSKSDDLVYEEVQKLQYLQQVWKETLRLHPTAAFMLRVATKDSVLPGSRVMIPEGVQVGVLIAGAQRNPKYIANPDDFLPERWAPGASRMNPCKVFMPYSCGPERCPGQAMADYESIAILAAIFRSFNVSLACEQDSIVGFSGWTERPRGPAPGAPSGDTSWTLPVLLERRKD